MRNFHLTKLIKMMILLTFKRFFSRIRKNFLPVGTAMVVVFAAFPAFSQDVEEASVIEATTLRLGAQIGITQGTFAFNQQNFTDNKVGLLLGAFAHYNPDFLPSWLTLSGEINYQQQGAANIEAFTGDPNIRQNYNIIQHNISVPVMGILTPPKFLGSNITPYIGAGIAWGYNMKSYQQTTTTSGGDDGFNVRVTSFTDKSREYFQNTMSALLAGGFLINTEKWLWTLEARYELGITNLNNVSNSPSTTFTGNTFILKVGVGFLDLF